MKTSDSGVGTLTVQRALNHLGYRDRGTEVTIEDLAGYLKCSGEHVRKILLGLRRRRLVKDAKRKGRRIWMPWEGQR